MCLHPWNNIDIALDGNIMPCCKWPAKLPGKKFNIHDATGIDDYRNSPMLQDLKTKLSNHEWHDGCYRCRQDEERGIVSKRQHDAPIYQDRLKNTNNVDSDFLTVATELGLSCNLACVICGPTKSTTWQTIIKQQQLVDFVKPQNRVQDRVKTIKQFDSILHFELHGGDPLITNQSDHLEVLDYFIESGKATEMSLKYHTNGTVYPNKKIIDRWTCFGSIELSLSIDAIGEVFEYQRWPGNWNHTEKNIGRLKKLQEKNYNIKITIQCTFSAYNIYFLEELYQWSRQQSIVDIWFTEAIFPETMQATVWPMHVRKQIATKLENSDCQQLQNLSQYLISTDNSHLFEKFVKYNFYLDNIRNLNHI